MLRERWPQGDAQGEREHSGYASQESTPPQVSEIILFILEAFKPPGSPSYSSFRERWLCRGVYSMKARLLIQDFFFFSRGKGGLHATVCVQRQPAPLAASPLSHPVPGSSHFSAAKPPQANRY